MDKRGEQDLCNDKEPYSHCRFPEIVAVTAAVPAGAVEAFQKQWYEEHHRDCNSQNVMEEDTEAQRTIEV